MGFVRSDLEYILNAVKSAEERARAEHPALAGPLSFSAAFPGFEANAMAAAEPNGAPSAEWMRLYAQLFDYRFEAAQSVGAGARFIPLAPGDFHFDPAATQNYLVLETSPSAARGGDAPVDSPYAIHPSVIALLRAYKLQDGRPVSTGEFLTASDGGPARWSDLAGHALDKLGLVLRGDHGGDAPLLATDPFGALALGPNGRAQLVGPQRLLEADPRTPVDAALALRSGQALRLGEGEHALLRQAPIETHNFAVRQIKTVLLSIGDVALLNEFLSAPVDEAPRDEAEAQALPWNGDLLFQTARYETETTRLSDAFFQRARSERDDDDAFGAPTQDGSDSEDDAASVADSGPSGAPDPDFDLAFLASLARQAATEDGADDPIAAALAYDEGSRGDAEIAAGEVVVVQLIGVGDADGSTQSAEAAEAWGEFLGDAQDADQTEPGEDPGDADAPPPVDYDL